MGRERQKTAQMTFSRRWALRSLSSDYFIFGLSAIFFIALAPFTPGLASKGTMLNILAYLLPLFIAASGLTLVMITGGIDLSITATIAFTSVLGAKAMTGQTGLTPTLLGCGAMLLAGGVIGAVNGTIVAFLRLPPFIVTLAAMMFLNGFAVWFTQSNNIFDLPAPFLRIGKQLPLAVAIASTVAVLLDLALRQTAYGRWLYATGQNVTAAAVSGVPVRGVTFASYVLSGICAGLASVFLTARLETGSPVLGREMLLDVVGATVVGGASLFGGKGKIAWTFGGVLFLTLLDTTLNLLNLSQFSITIAKGAVILAATILDTARQRWIPQSE